MPTKVGGYFLDDGTRVPSVTTIISRFKDAGGLIHWAWNLGREGKDYRAERDKAADSGTLAHTAVEKWIKQESMEWIGELEVVEKAQVAFSAFLKWAAQTKLSVSHQELALISHQYKFGGTFDAILVQGKRAMGDWKTSNGLYPEYLIQVAAYGHLWMENYPEEPINGGYHILRFDKEFGDFHAHHWSELNRAWEAFLHLRALYEIDKELKKRSG